MQWVSVRENLPQKIPVYIVLKQDALQSWTLNIDLYGSLTPAKTVGGDLFLMDDGTYEVVLEMPIFGAADSLSDAAFLPFKDEPKVSFPQPSTSTSVTVNYTGLIIDCRGMNLNCVMSPVIKNDNNQAIYGHQNLDYDKIIVNGMASYANSAEDEISRSRAGNNPLIVKAVNLADLNANPVVSTADADKILAANRQGKFLENCAVVFVY